MGWYKYFSVFKFFWYGLTSRRNRKLLKMLLICIGVAMVIFWLSMNVEVQASTMTNENITESIKYKYDSICFDFVQRFDKSTHSDKSVIKTNILSNFSYYIYYGNDNGSSPLDSGTNNDTLINIVFYNPDSQNWTSTFANYTYYYGLECNHILQLTRQDSPNFIIRALNQNGQITTSFNPYIYIPSELLHYHSWVIYDYFYGDSTLEEIKAQLETANAKLDTVNDNLEDINDTLSNTTVDDSLITTVNDSTQDITENGVSTVFTKFYDALTNYDTGTTGFSVDIMGASFDITSDMIYDLMIGNNLQWLIGIIHSFYWYWVCRYCVKDIYRYISKIKDGTIMTSSETNIKEEML